MGVPYIPYAGPPNSGIWEIGQTTVDVNGNEWLCKARGVANQPGTVFIAVGGSSSNIPAADLVQVAEPTGIAAVDTVAINTAITTANASTYAAGIQFYDGEYLTGGGHAVGGGANAGLVLQGIGWNTEIALANSADQYMFTCGTVYTRGLYVNNIRFQGNGNNQTGGGIFDGSGCVWSRIDNCWFDNPWSGTALQAATSGAAVKFYQNGTGGFGQGNIVSNCLFWNSNGSTYLNQIAILTYQSDENIIVNNRFQGYGNDNTYPSAVFDQSGLNDISHNSFVVGSGIYCGGSGSRSRIYANIMDGCQATNGQIYAGSSGVIVHDNHCYNISGGQDGIYVDNTDHVSVMGNVGQTASGASVQSLVHLGGTPTYCLIDGNMAMTLGGGVYTAAGGIKIDSATSLTGTVIRNNIPFNPANVSTPSFPSTTSTYTNATGIDVYAYVTNGVGSMSTVINGRTGPTLGASLSDIPIFIPAGGSFTPTYGSGSPSWVFQGN